MTIYSDESNIRSTGIKNFLDHLSDKVNERLHDKIKDFSISEERLKAFTGHTWEQVLKIQEMLTSMRNSENRNILQALIIFLFKIRTANSNRLIAAILDIKIAIVNDSIISVIKCLKEVVLPQKFGLPTYTRDFLLTQTSKVPELLYGFTNCLVLICDGTYLRHEKSSNNIYQRKAYSGQKKSFIM